jgi:ABC transporter substrate binding protein
VLRPNYSPDPSHPSDAQVLAFNAFGQGLRDLGYVEGQNIRLEYRYAAYQWDRLPALAADLVQLKPAVIVTNSTQAVLAAQQATTTISIVQAVGGARAELGLVASLARPGGNITGQIHRDPELAGKRLEMLTERRRILRRGSFVLLCMHEDREIGCVQLPTGWLVAADALFEPQFPSFGQTVAPAEAPVCLAIAHLADGD